MDLLAGFCAGVLIYAALGKIGSFQAFGDSLKWIAPSATTARWLGAIVIVLEASIGAGLLVPVVRADAALAGMALLSLFATSLIYARFKGLGASCMCFGGSAEPITSSLIVRDVVLAVLLWSVSFSGSEGSPYLESAGVGGFLLMSLAAGLRTTLGWIRTPSPSEQA